MVIKPSHTDIFVPEFAQQLLEAQKEAKVFQAITKKPKAAKDSPAFKRGKGGRGYKGKHFRGQGRGQHFQPNYQPSFNQQWGTPPPNSGFAQSQQAFNPFSYTGAQPAPSQPARGRGRGKPRGGT